jgi:hypothetical protein
MGRTIPIRVDKNCRIESAGVRNPDYSSPAGTWNFGLQTKPVLPYYLAITSSSTAQIDGQGNRRNDRRNIDGDFR